MGNSQGVHQGGAGGLVVSGLVIDFDAPPEEFSKKLEALAEHEKRAAIKAKRNQEVADEWTRRLSNVPEPEPEPERRWPWSGKGWM